MPQHITRSPVLSTYMSFPIILALYPCARHTPPISNTEIYRSLSTKGPFASLISAKALSWPLALMSATAFRTKASASASVPRFPFALVPSFAAAGPAPASKKEQTAKPIHSVFTWFSLSPVFIPLVDFHALEYARSRQPGASLGRWFMAATTLSDAVSPFDGTSIPHTSSNPLPEEEGSFSLLSMQG